jgi:hypothetical protein
METMDQFLSTFLATKPHDLWFYLWTDGNKTSHWFRDIHAASKKAESLASDQNVYIGMALSKKQGGVHQRVKMADAAGIMGCWVDLDIDGPGHKKPNLPPTLEDAQNLIRETGLEPTLVVSSGGGLHAYWLFHDAWIFEDDADRNEAQKVVTNWMACIKVAAAKHGWDVDSTFDLARVLRVAGTYNHKHSPAKLVELVSCNLFQRYSIDELRREPPEPEKKNRPEKVITPNTKTKELVNSASIIVSVNAQPDMDKFMQLLENPQFKKTWERQRKDLKDQSRSGYAFSLALFGIHAGWTDQEITNLIIAWYRKHGEEIHNEARWYHRTIDGARKKLGDDEAQERLESAIESDSDAPFEMDDDTKSQHIQDLSCLFGVPINRIVKYLSDPPIYTLQTSLGEMLIGDIDRLISFKQFYSLVLDRFGIALPTFSSKQWRSYSTLLVRLREEEEAFEATHVGMIDEWVTSYLIEREVSDSLDESIDTKRPYRKNDDICFFIVDFENWLSVNRTNPGTRRDLFVWLRDYGCTPYQDHCIQNNKRTSRVWKISKGVDTFLPIYTREKI